VLERDSQLAALASYADEARAGAGRMVLVGGEAGIGKSTLVEELEGTLPSGTWWWGACDGLSTPRALGPLSDIAVQAGGELRAACDADAARDVRFDALTRMLRTGDELRVVVIEDVHWADDATLDMLRFLGRRIRRRGALIAFPTLIDRAHFAGPQNRRFAALPPLSEQANIAAAGTDVNLLSCIWLTGGSPFFVTEVPAAGALGPPRPARCSAGPCCRPRRAV
jgi:predicted ATPase